MSKNEKQIKWVVAQSLIGGMALGFENSFKTPPSAIITAGFEQDTHYIKYQNETKNLNIPIINMESDYKTFKSKEDEELYNLHCQNVDVLMHVAACAGLSQMNPCNEGSKARGCADNDQNQNMYNLTKLGMRMNAKTVVFENAPTAYTKSGEAVVNKLRDIAAEFNYSTHLYTTDTLFHGTPQSRKRTFVMFYKDKLTPKFNYEQKEITKLSDYLELIPKDSKQYNDYILEEKNALDELYFFILENTKSKTFLEAINKLDPNKSRSTWTSAQLTEKIGFDIALDYLSKNSTEKQYNIVKHYKTKREQGKSFWDNTTILANRGEFINAIVGKSLTSMVHPTEERGYNVRELLWLMGMPHDFELMNFKKNWNHICQNVPVKTATFIANNLKDYLNGNLTVIESEFMKQSNFTQSIDLILQDDNW